MYLIIYNVLFSHEQVLVRNHFAGLNYIDINHRSGTMKIRDGGKIIGVEASGVVEKLGSGVDGVAVGDRVAFEHFVAGELFLFWN